MSFAGCGIFFHCRVKVSMKKAWKYPAIPLQTKSVLHSFYCMPLKFCFLGDEVPKQGQENEADNQVNHHDGVNLLLVCFVQLLI